MHLDYHQATGVARIIGDDGRTIATHVGYAGRGPGLNNPDAESVRGVGPLPQGSYRIGPPMVHKRLGPLAFPLSRVGGDLYGRSGFFIHGDNRRRNRTASSGCIVLDRPARELIDLYDVTLLHVHTEDD